MNHNEMTNFRHSGQKQSDNIVYDCLSLKSNFPSCFCFLHFSSALSNLCHLCISKVTADQEQVRWGRGRIYSQLGLILPQELDLQRFMVRGCTVFSHVGSKCSELETLIKLPYNLPLASLFLSFSVSHKALHQTQPTSACDR